MFKVEDGTGLSDATSYTSVAEFDAYFADRGIDVSALNTPQKQYLLIKATDYVEQRWGMLFKGLREFDCQALSFPRLALTNRDGRDVEGVPGKLKYAVCEYAWKLNTAPLFPDLGDRSSQVTRLRQRVGPLEEETQYSSVAGSSTLPIQPYPQADRYLAEYVFPSGRVDRA